MKEEEKQVGGTYLRREKEGEEGGGATFYEQTDVLHLDLLDLHRGGRFGTGKYP